MTRQMIAANETVFRRLKEYVRQGAPEHIIVPGKRYINTKDEEKEWLKRLEIREEQSVVGNWHAAALSFRGEQYFAFVGWEGSPPFSSDILIEHDLNAGIVTALLAELPVPIRQEDPRLIADQIFHQTDEKPDDSDQWEYKFEKVKDFFEPILFYKIPEGSPLLGADLSRIAGYCVSQASDRLLLPFSKQTSEFYGKAFLEGSATIPYDNLLVSLTSSHWKFTFLDVYRCLERVFPIPDVEDLHRISGTTMSLLGFAAEIEDRLGWRAKEEDAMNRLIDADRIPKQAVALLRDVQQYLDHNQDSMLGKRVYKIRNSVVHHRPGTPPLNLDDEHWDKLISAAVLIVVHWYDEYESKINPPATAVVS